jgi:hypothetical protein
MIPWRPLRLSTKEDVMEEEREDKEDKEESKEESKEEEEEANIWMTGGGVKRGRRLRRGK